MIRTARDTPQSGSSPRRRLGHAEVSRVRHAVLSVGAQVVAEGGDAREVEGALARVEAGTGEDRCEWIDAEPLFGEREPQPEEWGWEARVEG